MSIVNLLLLSVFGKITIQYENILYILLHLFNREFFLNYINDVNFLFYQIE